MNVATKENKKEKNQIFVEMDLRYKSEIKRYDYLYYINEKGQWEEDGVWFNYTIEVSQSKKSFGLCINYTFTWDNDGSQDTGSHALYKVSSKEVDNQLKIWNSKIWLSKQALELKNKKTSPITKGKSN
jgi:hypothetical protein